LGILVGMSGLGRAGILDPFGWGLPGVVAAVFQEIVSPYGWNVCMMLFGFYFPQRWNLDEKLPWLKWVLLVPAAALAALHGTSRAFEALSYPSFAALRDAFPIPDWAQTVFMMVIVCFFFIGLSTKLRDASVPRDDRRRIGLLYFGCTIAMTPMFLLFIFDGVVNHRQPGDADGRWLTFSLMMMSLFPIVMAYVIVVERAMDVRMFIRQGVQYTLARRGLHILTACIVVAIIFTSANLLEGPHTSRPQKLGFLAVGIVLVLRLRDVAERVRRWLDRRFFREAYNAEKILGDLSEQVRTILDRNTLLETVTRKLSESLHVDRVAVVLQEGAFFRPAFATGYGSKPEVALPAEGAIVEELRRTREPLVVSNSTLPAERQALGPLGAQLLLPLASKKDLLGFISLGPKKSEEPYSASDTSLLRTVAAQTGLALENTRLSEAIATEAAQRERLHRELEIAREVQERLFPQTMPPVATLEYAGHCRPASGVGGDYYDFLALTNGHLGLAIGDISGKGVPAALLMASLQASVRGQSQGLNADGRPDIAGLITNVNRLVFDASPQNRYATFFYAQFDPLTRVLTYTNGGHNAPMLIRGAEVLRLETGGPPVGLFRPSRYEQAELRLTTGDLLILYTDGISEAENPAEDEWGEDALISAVRTCASAPPAEMIATIMRLADAFASGAPQHDDMTLVVARVL
jgi:sigma-B regulation protein RsbU (phosphoserine phosphatase)